jgi:hypothetical protein
MGSNGVASPNAQYVLQKNLLVSLWLMGAPLISVDHPSGFYELNRNIDFCRSIEELKEHFDSASRIGRPFDNTN